MDGIPPTPLRIVVADERHDAIDRVRELVNALGHELVATETGIEDAARVVVEQAADIAIVAVHADTGHALELVERLNDEGPCPVVLVLDDDDSRLVAAASDRGLDAFTTSDNAEGLQSAIEMALRRDEQALELLADLGEGNPRAVRRQTIDRATGVLMERLELDGDEAYQRLRAEARRTRTALVILAQSVLRARSVL